MGLISFFASFVIICLWGFIGHKLAIERGRNPNLWCVLACVFNLIAILILVMMKKKERIKVPLSPLSEAKPLAEIVQENWYFLNTQQERLGPISFSELKEHFEKGALTNKTFVWNETYTDWKKLEEDIVTIKELEKKANS